MGTHSARHSKWYGNTVRDRVHIWCHGLLFSTIFMFYYAVLHLPVGDLQCLFYQSPLWIIFCCWLCFGERMCNLNMKKLLMMPMELLFESLLLWSNAPMCCTISPT